MPRCPWPTKPLDVEYHDREWGVPVHDDGTLFEFITLEGAQAGLSWSTVLAKRDGYRRLWTAVRSAADADEDGMVSAAEYRAWAAREAASDGDRSGFATAVRPLAEAVIALVDEDADRALDRAELDRLLTACRS